MPALRSPERTVEDGESRCFRVVSRRLGRRDPVKPSGQRAKAMESLPHRGGPTAPGARHLACFDRDEEVPEPCASA